jgi:hypothetical protein
MKPTVGRIVHYYPVGSGPDWPPLAAIIVHVWCDTLVNLAVFGRQGTLLSPPAHAVQLLEAGMPIPAEASYCKWPERV